MKKVIFRPLLFVLLLTGLISTVGCRMNNGDIGPLYGTWNIEKMTVDGEIYEDWRSELTPWTTVEFQNNICLFRQAIEPNDYVIRVCTWTWAVSGDRVDRSVMQLDFEHYDNANPVGTGMYAPPGWLKMEGRLHYEILVEWSDHDRRMKWTTVNQAGQKLEFYLKQTW